MQCCKVYVQTEFRHANIVWSWHSLETWNRLVTIRNKIFKLDTQLSFIYRLNFLKIGSTRRYYFSWNVFVSSREQNLLLRLWWTNEQRYPQVSLSSRSEGNVSNSIARGNEATNARPTFSPCILRINCNHFFSRNFHRRGGQYLFRLHPTS